MFQLSVNSMLRRPHLLRCLALAVAVGYLCVLSVPAVAPPKSPPNILFLFADDMSFETIRALGNDEIQTPHLDRLVETGTTFTHAYNMGAWHGAVCVASRTMLNTGRFVWRARALEPRLNEEIKARRFWAQLMAEAGYETYLSGKWHVQADATQAFQHTAHIRPGMPRDTPSAYQRPMAGERDPWKPWDRAQGGFWEGGTHWSEALADDGIAFLRQASASAKPFFMYLAFNAPHDPRQSPKESVDRYPLETISVPANYLPEYPYMEEMGCGRDLRDERLAPWPRTELAVKTHRREYYALITHLDAQIGRILHALEASGEADRTCIFFTADHGLAVGHHGLWGKQNMYEHSLRPPLIIAGPGIPQGRRIDTPVYLQDIMPSTLELAGRSVPLHVEFKSLLPLIRGERERQYEAIYGAYREDRQRMILRDGFKLIHYPAIDRYRLFDLRNDPEEMDDLAAEPDHAVKLEKLIHDLRKIQQTMDDPILKPRA